MSNRGIRRFTGIIAIEEAHQNFVARRKLSVRRQAHSQAVVRPIAHLRDC
jgi:hypothetical protein